MKKSIVLALSALTLCACSSNSSTAAVATASAEPEETEETVVETRDIDIDQLVKDGMKLSYASVYGVYNQEGESPDSSIKVTVYVNDDTDEVEYIDIEEALIPYSTGGAEGWAILDEATVKELGDDVLTVGENSYPVEFEYNGVFWNGSVKDDAVVYTADIDGTETQFMDYIATQEGGKWYHDGLNETAKILDKDENAVAEVEIGTKASINHGVDFWASSITFPGNLELIKNYIYDNGVTYEEYPSSKDIAQNEDGQWVVDDVVTGATLAGTPNYLNLIKDAYDAVEAGNGTEYKAN